jgi:hypothetical protein
MEICKRAEGMQFKLFMDCTRLACV